MALIPDGEVPLDGAIRALQDHPRFPEAVRTAIGGLTQMYGRNRLLNRVVNDRGRAIGGLVALYLHFSPASGATTGLTVGRFQAFCTGLKLCSPGRARALLMLMRAAGYLASAPGGSDRRQRRLAPTKQLIEMHRQRWKCQFDAMALVLPEGERALAEHGRPEFEAAFVRHLGRRYLAGFRVLDHAPDLASLVERNGGLLILSSLLLAVRGGVAPNGTVVLTSISGLSRRFGISRAHTRKLLADASALGLVAQGGEHEMIVLPRLVQVLGAFYAALFAVLAHAAAEAVREVGEAERRVGIGHA